MSEGKQRRNNVLKDVEKIQLWDWLRRAYAEAKEEGWTIAYAAERASRETGIAVNKRHVRQAVERACVVPRWYALAQVEAGSGGKLKALEERLASALANGDEALGRLEKQSSLNTARVAAVEGVFESLASDVAKLEEEHGRTRAALDAMYGEAGPLKERVASAVEAADGAFKASRAARDVADKADRVTQELVGRLAALDQRLARAEGLIGGLGKAVGSLENCVGSLGRELVSLREGKKAAATPPPGNERVRERPDGSLEMTVFGARVLTENGIERTEDYTVEVAPDDGDLEIAGKVGDALREKLDKGSPGAYDHALEHIKSTYRPVLLEALGSPVTLEKGGTFEKAPVRFTVNGFHVRIAVGKGDWSPDEEATLGWVAECSFEGMRKQRDKLKPGSDKLRHLHERLRRTLLRAVEGVRGRPTVVAMNSHPVVRLAAPLTREEMVLRAELLKKGGAA
jgi:hypothetical protein